MSDFLNFIHKEQQKKMTEEERLALHKKQKLRESQHYDVDELEDEDDDFYDEPDNRLVEAHRVPRQPQRRIPAPQPIPQAPTMPQEPEYDEPYEEPVVAPTPRRRRTPATVPNAMAESYRQPMNPVLTEAYELIEEMKNKMETMFFKYGMTGLERLNECMLDVCDEIMNPPAKPYKPMAVQKDDYFDDELPVIEKVLPKKKTNAVKESTVHKPVKKAAVVSKPTVVSKPKVVKTEEETLKEKAKKMNAMFENADFSELGDTLVKQSDVQVNSGVNRKAEIEARGKALEEKMTKKTKKQQKETITENELPEEIEIVPDGTIPLEINEDQPLEPAELDNPA